MFEKSYNNGKESIVATKLNINDKKLEELSKKYVAFNKAKTISLMENSIGTIEPVSSLFPAA